MLEFGVEVTTDELIALERALRGLETDDARAAATKAHRTPVVLTVKERDAVLSALGSSWEIPRRPTTGGTVLPVSPPSWSTSRRPRSTSHLRRGGRARRRARREDTNGAIEGTADTREARPRDWPGWRSACGSRRRRTRASSLPPRIRRSRPTPRSRRSRTSNEKRSRGTFAFTRDADRGKPPRHRKQLAGARPTAGSGLGVPSEPHGRADRNAQTWRASSARRRRPPDQPRGPVADPPAGPPGDAPAPHRPSPAVSRRSRGLPDLAGAPGWPWA